MFCILVFCVVDSIGKWRNIGLGNWWMYKYVLIISLPLVNLEGTKGLHSVCHTSFLDFLVHLGRRLKCTIVIMLCPSSVVVNFSHFRHLLWKSWREFNETWQEARSQRPLQSLCFSGRSEEQDCRPGLWLVETFSTSPLKLLNGIQRNLTGSKISTSSTKFVFFGLIGRTRWPPWPLIGWDIFDFSSETTERNSTKLYREQDLIVLYQVCVFLADQKNKMATLASDWLRHFQLLLWNRSTEFKDTWQEARCVQSWQEVRCQSPLPIFFSGQSKNQVGRPCWLSTKVAHCTQVHDMWPSHISESW